MLKEIVVNTAVRLGVDARLRSVCTPLFASLRRDTLDNQHLRLLLSFALAEDSNCVDIGANKGEILAEIVRAAPRGRHIAYEPLPHLHSSLSDQFPSVDVRLAAVSNEEGEASFTHVRNLATHSGLREITYPVQPQLEKMTVRTETLDSSLPTNYVPTLIKIDVEGAERQVIEGAINTISKHKPIVVFEHGKQASSYYDTLACHIFKLLHDEAGLRIFDMDGNGPFTLGRFEEIYASGKLWNFVAHS